jgi:hypothetical protein
MCLLRSVCRIEYGRASLDAVLTNDFDVYSKTRHRQKRSIPISNPTCSIIPNTARYHPSPTYQTSALPTAYIVMAADLTHATLVRNPEYERNGLKSYVRALQKYGITPTVPGPYCLASKPESDVQGTFTDHSGKILTQEFQLVKRDAETAHAGTVPVCLSIDRRRYGPMLTSKSGRGRRTQLPVPCRSRHRHSAAAHQTELRHRICRHMGVEHPPP